ncbi:Predicted arabinose efflux permease, MFS family [Cribrihabitans marinus]|uniref:Predicted arabinose efflux permease, MFS family n=1 Tax=Cribrihabitans marinus TaxID=1227549 RepID=A0A1H6YGQ5_9RHOB|nr:MFS transporter [Cribrihabitans marinus]GGH29213.1 MFS transporter [Cribrihabitans marinus]SEJ40488.1 Predicted arabinose efflux permease, MFS family [Cribrihabitans marinus]
MRSGGLGAYLAENAPWLSAGILLTFLSSFGQTFFISIFAGEIRAEFGLSHGQWGGIYTLGTSVSALIMVWAGGLTDRFRVRALGPVVLVGLAMACLSMAIAPWAAMLPLVILLLRFFGQGMSSHIAMVAMTRWFAGTRGRALSIATLGFAAGEALLPLGFVAAKAVIDWRWLWVIAAGVALLGLPVLMRLLRHERTPQSMAESDSSTGMRDRHWTRAQALRHPLFWCMVPAMLGPAAFNTAFFFHQVHLAEIKGWAHVELVALFPAYTGLSMLAMFATGWALDRWGTARLIPFYLLPIAAGFLAFSAAVHPSGAMLGLALMALTTGANTTLPSAFWAEFYGTAHIGSIKALAAAVMVLGSAIGPGLTGVLIDAGMGMETQFIAIAGYFLLASLFIVMGLSVARRAA